MNTLFKKYTIILLVMSFVTSCSNQLDDESNTNQFTEVKYDRNLPLDSFALAIQKHYQLPGLAIATIGKSQIDELVVVGKNKTKDGVLLNKQSQFQIASCTKSFTALLVASYVEEGLINWDTKISDVFADMNIHSDYQEITISQILSHSAGLPQFWTDEEVFNIQNIIPKLRGSTSEKRKIFTKWNLSRQAPFIAGEHNYSNGGYIIIAAMLEKLTGKPYEELMEERVFIPLEINSAKFGYPFLYDSIQPHRHMNRSNDGIGITMDAHARMPDPIFNPCGYISISMEDFTKYIIFHTQAIKGEKTRINSSIIQELFIPKGRIDDHSEAAMGWQIIYVNGTKTFGHTGCEGTMRSAMSINPETGQAVVFLTNIGDQRSEMAMVNVVFELLDL